MKLSHYALIVVFLVIGYVAGVKFPALASKIGIA